MGLFDRIILALYTFCLAFISLGVILMGLPAVPIEFFEKGLHFLYGRWDFAFIGVIFFIISLRLLFSGLSRSHKKILGIVKEGKMGQLRVSFEAINQMVQYTAFQIHGIQDLRTKVNNNPEGVFLQLEVIIVPGVNIDDMTAKLQQRVKEHIEEALGIPVKEIQVVVARVTGEIQKSKTMKRVQ